MSSFCASVYDWGRAKLAGNHDAAERAAEVITPGDQARLWLFGVARNLLRKHAGRLRASNALVRRITEELRASSTRLPDRGASPDADRLAAALASLWELDREIITLTAWEGLIHCGCVLERWRVPDGTGEEHERPGLPMVCLVPTWKATLPWSDRTPATNSRSRRTAHPPRIASGGSRRPWAISAVASSRSY